VLLERQNNFMKIFKGFTLIEIIIAVGIMLAVLSFVLANYYRGGNDSVLSRETSLFMSRMRYAQELTSSGKTISYCDHYSGLSCTNDADCYGWAPAGLDPGGVAKCLLPEGPSGTLGTYNSIPLGGYTVSLSCGSRAAPADPVYNPLVQNNIGTPSAPVLQDVVDAFGQPVVKFPLLWRGANKNIFLFADNISCTGECYPLQTWNKNFWTTNQGDNLIMNYLSSSNGNYYANTLKGDLLLHTWAIDKNVSVKDIQLTESPIVGRASRQFSCAGFSPWKNSFPFSGSGQVRGDYPLQASISFIPPDARTVLITDNVSVKPPPASGSAGDYQQVEVLLKLNKRDTDCRVVTVTRTGVISQRTDADCDLATAN
jgi:prepilin-type N-terminal cleavage/methylation domain-containing protein